ncbi:single-stranded DNA-binding protein [Chryseobacterium sp. RLHN22]|uniref:single-stranded DNA-binding protein n=1 Tax=Chryseobacterium sp. RLHN22 TaxID=3437885 RepID=UPI003D9AD251
MNIIGRLTKDAEVRTLSNKKQVVNFSIATNDNYRNKQGVRIEQTTYFDCSYWISPKVAEILTKGALVELSGRAYTSAWIGKDGEAHAGLNFHTSRIKFHGGGNKAETTKTASKNSSKSAKVKTEKSVSNQSDEDDDLPF